MAEKQRPAYYALIGVSLVASILAVVTLLPSPGARKPNIFGYRSVCSFAPAATALCGLAAGITCTIRNRLVSIRRSSTRFQPPIAAVGVGLLLAAVAVVAGARFAAVQSRFGEVVSESQPVRGALGVLRDGTRSATVTEGEVSATVTAAVSGGRVASLALGEATNVEASVAAAIFEAVKQAQSTAVDVVSGATASSQVLLKAIEQATGAAP
jgi:uncharacterized protein with FMN-binding domain